jgi:hypothetical protein
MDKTGERLEFYRREKGYTLKDIAKTLDLTEGAIRNAIKRDSIKPSHINVICEHFNVSKDWLLHGTGEMEVYNYVNKKEVNNSLHEPKINYQKGVPYYDIDFTAGFLEVTNGQNTKPDSYIDHPFFKGCDYVVRASGQSMAKVISHGDSIGLIRINNWQEFFPFGEIYAIVTTDNFRMIKVITKGDAEEYYTLISKPTDSKKDDFPPQQIKKSSISAIFKVQASSHLF